MLEQVISTVKHSYHLVNNDQFKFFPLLISTTVFVGFHWSLRDSTRFLFSRNVAILRIKSPAAGLPSSRHWCYPKEACGDLQLDISVIARVAIARFNTTLDCHKDPMSHVARFHCLGILIQGLPSLRLVALKKVRELSWNNGAWNWVSSVLQGRVTLSEVVCITWILTKRLKIKLDGKTKGFCKLFSVNPVSRNIENSTCKVTSPILQTL